MCDIALGLQSADLEWFAAGVNASFMAQWREMGLFDEDVEGWGQAFEQVITRTLAAGGRIHFNLSGMDVSEALSGDPGCWVGRYTAWELQQIVRQAEWFDSTVFYLDSAPLTAEQLAEKQLLRP